MKHLLVLMAVLGLSFAQIGCGASADKPGEKKAADKPAPAADGDKAPAEGGGAEK